MSDRAFDKIAAIATMHRKECVIGPILLDGLGLQVTVAAGVDTDTLGTFTGEINRAGSPRETAMTKARLALLDVPHADYGLGSEGSFCPHPLMPFITAGHETIVLLSRDEEVLVQGDDLTTQTNCIDEVVTTVDEAFAAARRLRFPSHCAVVTGVCDGRASIARSLTKGIESEDVLRKAVSEAISLSGAACVQSDMRAHCNPTRMRAIGRAARELVRRATCCCPDCSYPGYDLVERVAGLPCIACGEPSDATHYVVVGCARCQRREVRPRDGRSHVDAGGCSVCNP